ncbi:uncharacterized protein LOC123426869 [Hordeum vulgare subsp. vulgare]|uniref:uncharacterized protein LOC123426869 n=1 Tax=Hordeum vulgare subsp. vulgare TaxID=112509 RepID=UPI001D1A3EC1|nr:uncharacterized protein LOC123426869 [Hordeum vulgare subsp. vulgare]
MCFFLVFLTHIIPCNVRLDFNELISEDTVIFDSPRGPYTREVNKGRNITQIGQDEWDRFIARMDINGGELMSFSFRRKTSRLAVIYLNYEKYDDDPLDEAIFSQRITRLSEDETDMLWEKLPPRDAYVGMPFATRVTQTMVNYHVMKLPKNLCVSCGIEPDEEVIAGPRLTTRGVITTCDYVVHTDGHNIFSATRWSNFLAGKNLRVGHTVLVTIRNTPCHDLRIMIVIKFARAK